MLRHRTLILMALLGASGAALAAAGEDTPPAPDVFVTKAALAGLTEVELAKVALKNSQNPLVRDFAQRMVTDHTKANEELAAIAASKGIATPKRLDAEHQTTVEQLQAKSGPAFDATYSRHMNMDHTKAVALFEATSKSSDAELAKFALRTLPTLKEHKELASKLPQQ
jgi:putative membrane protein